MFLTTLFYLLSLVLVAATGRAEPKRPTVVVVGAGLAGLTTAHRLHQRGFDVQVYEARNRVGGRVFTALVEGHVAELGGQDITDGGKAENFRRLLSEFQLETIDNELGRAGQYFNGKTFMDSVSGIQRGYDLETLHSMLGEAVKKSQNMRDVLSQFLNEEEDLYKILSVGLAAYEGAPIEKLSPFYSSDTLLQLLSGGMSTVRLKANTIEFSAIKGGNALLPQGMAKSLGNRVHLNMPLTAVSKGLDGSYQLKFRDASTIKADILVLAMPASVYSDIDFEENLIPKERLAAIRSTPYGTNAKVLVPFPKPLEERGMLINEKVIGLFDTDNAILTLYCTGDVGLFTEETLPETYLQNRPMLEMAFKELCPLLATPTLARDEPMASYDGPVGHSWPNDPYVKGSYSYVAPGQEELLMQTQKEGEETVRTLFAPIDNRLYFAGEHTTILMEVQGTMEAACESGERAARMIEKSLNLSQ